MSIVTVSEFNELHQKALGHSPKYSAPEILSLPPYSQVRVKLFVGDDEFVGEAQNQKLARQAAVDEATRYLGRLPTRLGQYIADSI